MARKVGIALGFYQNFGTATAVFKKLRRAGFRRSAYIRHTHDDKIVVVTHPHSFLFWALITTLIGLVIGSIIAYKYPAIEYIELPVLIILGFLIGWFGSYFAPQIDKKHIDRFKNIVIKDETLVIAEVDSKNVSLVLKLLRDVESGHPISFYLRPDLYGKPDDQSDLPKEPLSIEHLHEHAQEIARSLRHTSQKKSDNHSLLKRLGKSAKVLNSVQHDVAEAEYVEQTITLSAEWLLDNTHAIQTSIEEIQRNLPKKYYHELPKIIEGPYNGFPRIYVIADEIIKSSANKLTPENIISFLQSFQTICPLTMGELWAMPLMLRLRLIECVQFLAVEIERRLREGELACFWGNRLLNVARRQPERIPKFIEQLKMEQAAPSPHFAEELLDHLFDEETVVLVRNWLEEKFHQPAAEVINHEQMRKTAEQVALSSSIVSLIHLSQISWREIFEAVSLIDAILTKDPINAYARMDFTTRDNYRHSIEVIAKNAKKNEIDVAKQTLQIAAEGTNEVSKHVGYYLIDAGRKELENITGCRPTPLQRSRRWMMAHSAFVYLGSIGFLTTALAAYMLYFSIKWSGNVPIAVIFTFLGLLPISEFVIQIVNLVLAKILSPCMLPKMAYKQGVPGEYPTLVVMPMMLQSVEGIAGHLERLEIHYLANLDPAIRFALFSDYSDAVNQNMPEDKSLLEVAVKGIENLEKKYGPGRFFLFHRERIWSPSENCWIGWERKRGKLEYLNRFLRGKPLPQQENILKVGRADRLKNIKYVITLDADTQLPKDKARQMVETLSHPLNIPRLSANGKSIERGYTIIQPRVETDFPHAETTLFTR